MMGVGDRTEYDRALARRGDFTVWLSPEAIHGWKPRATGKWGRQRKRSNLSIEISLILRLIVGLPLRQTGGFLNSTFKLMGVELAAPDHTTLSRLSRQLQVKPRHGRVKGPLHLIVDSTGLSIEGEVEWAAIQHGGKDRRGWKKLHLGGDGSGVIVAQVLTDGDGDDARSGLDCIRGVQGDIASITPEPAYDTIAI